MNRLHLNKEQALNMIAIDGSCLQSDTDEKKFALVFEGHQKRIVSLELTKNVLLKLKENIDLYFKNERSE